MIQYKSESSTAANHDVQCESEQVTRFQAFHRQKQVVLVASLLPQRILKTLRAEANILKVPLPDVRLMCVHSLSLRRLWLFIHMGRAAVAPIPKLGSKLTVSWNGFFRLASYVYCQ